MSARHTPDDEPPLAPAAALGDAPEAPLLSGCGWLIGAACIFNLACLPLIRASENSDAIWVWIAISLGVLAGELGTCTLWLVWGPGRFSRRLFLHWSVGLGLYLCWAIGLGVAIGSDAGGDQLTKAWWFILSGLPAVSLAAQLPMWPLRTHLGWRVERPQVAAEASSAPSLSILDMILATVVTSVSLAALRVSPEAMARPLDAGYWIAWAIAVLAIAAASAVFLFPALALALRISDPVAAIVALFGLTGTAFLVAVLTLSMLAPGNPPGEAVVGIGLCCASFMGTIAVPLLIVKNRGYTLWLARR